jgi:hypothetical protein
VDSALQPKFTKAKWIDNGNGQVTVITEGRNFSKDTQVLSGESVFDQTKKNLSVMGEQRLTFIGSAKNIAKFSPVVMNRYGMTTLISISQVKNPYSYLEKENVQFDPRGSQNTLVKITLKPKSSTTSLNASEINIFNNDNFTPPVVEIGDSIFGLSDAPFLTKISTVDKTIISFVVPNTILKKNSEIIIRELLNNDSKISVNYEDKKSKIATPFSVTSVQKMADDSDSNLAKLAIFGSGLDGKTSVVAGTTQNCSSSEVKSASLCLLTIPKSTKKVIISHEENDPIVIDLSQPIPFPEAAVIGSPVEPITKGDSKTVNLKMTNISSLKSIFFENIELTYKLGDDKNSIDLFIPQALTSTSGVKEITLVMKDDKRIGYRITIK